MAIEIPSGMSTKQFFTEFMPKQFKETTGSIDLSKYAGVDVTAVVELVGSSEVFSLIVKDGANLTVKEGTTAGALVYIEIANSIMNDFLAKKLPKSLQDELNATLADPNALVGKITGVDPADAKKKLGIIKGINGKVGLKANVDGINFEVNVRFNGAASPAFSVVGKFADLNKLIKGELNPIQGFMSGAYKIEGDMSLAMRLQPLMA